mmetsp:Transcript_19844/g.46136  ORF Transcript_19844/g.46136 Transcript_19844/m.46136 type:complete len:287 (-) Transcript_19844:2501-3361(-)
MVPGPAGAEVQHRVILTNNGIRRAIKEAEEVDIRTVEGSRRNLLAGEEEEAAARRMMPGDPGQEGALLPPRSKAGLAEAMTLGVETAGAEEAEETMEVEAEVAVAARATEEAETTNGEPQAAPPGAAEEPTIGVKEVEEDPLVGVKAVEEETPAGEAEVAREKGVRTEVVVQEGEEETPGVAGEQVRKRAKLTTMLMHRGQTGMVAAALPRTLESSSRRSGMANGAVEGLRLPLMPGLAGSRILLRNSLAKTTAHGIGMVMRPVATRPGTKTTWARISRRLTGKLC